jgi:glycosyltransferase involved in cell wall biosynthesis
MNASISRRWPCPASVLVASDGDPHKELGWPVNPPVPIECRRERESANRGRRPSASGIAVVDHSPLPQAPQHSDWGCSIPAFVAAAYRDAVKRRRQRDGAVTKHDRLDGRAVGAQDDRPKGGLLRESQQTPEPTPTPHFPSVACGTTREIPRDEQPVVDFDILILGPVPPPFGGISAHVSRLVPLLARAGFKVGVLNHFGSTDMPFVVAALGRNPINYYRIPKKFRVRIVHYHYSGWSELVALALARGSSDARYLLTLHSGAIYRPLRSKVPTVRRITRWALRRFDTIIAVHPNVASFIQSHVDEQRIEVVPAFLESGHDDRAGYDARIDAFLDSGRVLVVAAYGVRFLDDGRELYGLDMVAQAFTTLARDRKDLRLAIFLARRQLGPKPRRHLARLERRLEQAGLRDRAIIVFGLPLLPALRSNAVFVRPTRAEGDAVSVREAQSAGVPVVASDVVPRPSGVVIFPTDDVAKLCAALRVVLDHSDQPSRASTSGNVEQRLAEPFSDTLVRLYRRELASQAGETQPN